MSKALSALLMSIPDADLADYLVRLANECDSRCSSLISQLGTSWWPKWDRYCAEWDNDFSHRAVEPGIFEKANLSLNVPRRVCSFLAARSDDELFGTSPFFSAHPLGTEDQSFTRMVRHGIDYYQASEMAGFQQAGKDAVKMSWIMGAGIIKVARKRVARHYREFAMWLTDAQGSPVLLDGKPVVKETAQVVTQDGSDVFTIKGVEGEFTPESWRPYTVNRTEVLYDGPVAESIHYKRLLFDPTIATLEEQPFYAEKTSLRVADLKRLYGNGILPEEQLAGLIATSTKADPNNPAGAGTKGITVPTTTTLSWSELPIAQWVDCRECYIDWEVPVIAEDGSLRMDERGRPAMDIARLWVLMAASTKQIIWADYLGNVVPYGQQAHKLITAARKPGHCVGTGIFERFENEGKGIDRIFSQVSYRNRFAARPIRSYDPADFKQTAGGKPLQFTDDMVLEKQGQARNKPLSELIEFLSPPSMEEISLEILRMLIEVIERDSGVSSVAQGDFSDVPQNAPASGIKSILSSTSVFVKTAVRELMRGMESTLELFADWIFWRRDDPFEFQWMDQRVLKAASLQASQVANLRVRCRLSMSRFYGAEIKESIKDAFAFILEQLRNTPNPALAETLLPLFTLYLEQLSIPGAEDVFVAYIEELKRMATAPPPGASGESSGESLAIMPGGGNPPGAEPAQAPLPRAA